MHETFVFYKLKVDEVIIEVMVAEFVVDKGPAFQKDGFAASLLGTQLHQEMIILLQKPLELRRGEIGKEGRESPQVQLQLLAVEIVVDLRHCA